MSRKVKEIGQLIIEKINIPHLNPMPYTLSIVIRDIISKYRNSKVLRKFHERGESTCFNNAINF